MLSTNDKDKKLGFSISANGETIVLSREGEKIDSVEELECLQEIINEEIGYSDSRYPDPVGFGITLKYTEKKKVNKTA